MDNQQKDQSKASSTGPVPESVSGGANTGMKNAGAGRNEPPRNAAPNTPATGTPDAGNKLKDSATDLYEHAKDKASDSYDAVATKAKSAVNEKSHEFSAGLKTVADGFRHMGGQLRNTPESSRLTDMTSDLSAKAAGAIDNVAGYFERKDPRDMVRDVQGFARRNPAIFFGSAFALGLLAARFLKSSKPDQISRSANIPMEPSNAALPASTNRPEGGALPRTI